MKLDDIKFKTFIEVLYKVKKSDINTTIIFMKVSSSLSIIVILTFSYFFINHLNRGLDFEKVDK